MKSIIIHCDGGMRNRMAGWGFFGERQDIEETVSAYGPAGENVSNNVAELMAVTKALDFCVAEEIANIQIFTDSEYTIRCMNMVDVVEESGYDNVKNAEYRKRLAELKEIIHAKEMTVQFDWNKGHSGILGNEMADALATRGVIAQMNGLTEHCIEKQSKEIQKAEKEEKIDYGIVHPMITGRKWFFRTNYTTMTEDGRFMYTSTTYEENNKIGNNYAGKPAPDTHYSVVFAKEGVTGLENVKSTFNKIVGTEMAPVLVSLDAVKKDTHWKEIVRSHDSFLLQKGSLLITPNNELIGLIPRPPKLTFLLADYFGIGIEIIRRFEEKDESLQVVDVTEFFVSENSKGKRELTKYYGQGDKAVIFKNITLKNGKTIDLKLNAGIDIPTRNQLSNMIKLDPKAMIKMYAVIWDISQKSYHCGFLVETENAVAAYYTGESTYRIIG